MSKFLSIEELELPSVIKDIVDTAEDGLIIVGGQTGVGKTTTVHSIIDYINSTRKAVIATMSDPIEYHHEDKLSHVYQQEVNSYSGQEWSDKFNKALHMRPDVLVIEEAFRTWESAENAFYAASSGHLVIATMHTNNAVKTIERLMDFPPPQEQRRFRELTAHYLLAVINQRLARNTAELQKIPAVEIFRQTGLSTHAIEQNLDLNSIIPVIQKSGYMGMRTMEDDLLRLVGQGYIEQKEMERVLWETASYNHYLNRPL